MSLFAILAPPDNSKLGPAIETRFANNFYRVWNGQWIISEVGTAREISDKLGISDGSNGPGVVLAITTYWGNANTDLWEWMKSRLESK